MKLRATRQVLAVMAVATALCADRVTANSNAAPVARTPVAEMAGRLVMRLAQRLRRVVSAMSPWQVRQRGTSVVLRPALMPAPAFVAPRPISPFQFRLPPPVR
jgi:hypothetical protein